MPQNEAPVPRLPTTEAVLAALLFDEREGRPGPKAPRLNTGMGWQELISVLVHAEPRLDAEDEPTETGA
jgi:hypothetical protein